jgi:23S rRNA (cytidine2498-2'-O)-methyltransferase
VIALVSDDDSQDLLAAEIKRRWPRSAPQLRTPQVLTVTDDCLPSSPLMFVRQTLLQAEELAIPSISGWAKALTERIIVGLPDNAPWRLHLATLYGGDAKAGQNRLELIRSALEQQLKQRRRVRLKHLMTSEAPFSADEALVQLVLTSPDAGFLSVAPQGPVFEHRAWVSPFTLGYVPVAEDKSAPSRAFSKLVEAQKRLGRTIQPGETVIDLGASPGGWSYVALQQGAHVTAIDRSSLRDDLMTHRRLQFIQGDAFRYLPDQTVDWMVCDVIAAPERNIGLLLNWAKLAKMHHFIVSIKFQGHDDYPLLDDLANQLQPLCQEFRLTRLNANKNEACAFGTLVGAKFTAPLLCDSKCPGKSTAIHE